MELLSTIRLKAWRAVTWAYSNVRLGEFSRPGLRILAYHSIGAGTEHGFSDMFSMTPARFEQHMRHLHGRSRYRAMPLAVEALKGDATGIVVTFDDGYRDNLSVAAPLLAELGIPYTVFICTEAVAQRRAGFLDPSDVRELANMPGANIGSHTVTHQRLTECDDGKLAQELSDSKAYLQDLLGKEVSQLAYPYGVVNRRVRDAAEEAGYSVGVTCRFDRNLPGQDLMLLSRTTIYADDDMPVFEQKLQGKWDWYRWRQADLLSGM